MNRKKILETVVKAIVAALTAVITALPTASCMGKGPIDFMAMM